MVTSRHRGWKKKTSCFWPFHAFAQHHGPWKEDWTYPWDLLVDVTWSKSINKLENFIKVIFLSSKLCNLNLSSISPINNIQPSYRQIISAKTMRKSYLATGQIRYKPFLLNSLRKKFFLWTTTQDSYKTMQLSFFEKSGDFVYFVICFANLDTL